LISSLFSSSSCVFFSGMLYFSVVTFGVMGIRVLSSSNIQQNYALPLYNACLAAYSQLFGPLR
jgi:hypothetical protein